MGVDATREPPIVPDLDTQVAGDADNTLVDVFDPPDSDTSRWFDAAEPTDIALGNEVVTYISGAKLFKDMVAAIRTTKDTSHFIYLAGWNCNIDFALDPTEGPDTTLRALFSEANGRGVAIRAMLLKHSAALGQDNAPAVSFIEDTLLFGSAIHDERVMDLSALLAFLGDQTGLGHKVGAHHQKMLLVNGSEGLIAFQGGMDIFDNRLSIAGGEPLHDVHTRIMGPAAAKLCRIFVERWHDHPESDGKNAVPKEVAEPGFRPEAMLVQVPRTYPDGHQNSGIEPSGYAFARFGEQTLKGAVLHGIKTAREFIYLEDQYLVDMAISDALKDALPNLKKLIILICATDLINNELFQGWRRRKEFVDNLAPHGKKVSVCQLKTQFVHSKTWIFDDRLAIIGSANVNRRGFTHDSEQGAVIFDGNAKKQWFLAHELRMNLWAGHLRKRPIDMHDPIAASVHWFPPAANSRVARYDPNEQRDTPDPELGSLVLTDLAWDSLIDPDGSPGPSEI